MKLLTVATDVSNKKLYDLMASADKFGWNLEIIVTEWKGFGTKLIETYNHLKKNPQITKLGEKRWKEEAGKFKVNDGLGYVTQYSQIQGVIQNLAPSEEVEFSDSDIVPMPVVVKYFENEAVKYDLIAGEDTLSSLISSGIDTDPDIFVVDLTDLEEKERITEAKYQGKEVALNKPKRGGPKKFFVYTRNPKTGKTIKVNFGGTTGLTAKINNPEARRNFASRHNCDQKNDKTKPGYWSCRLPRYAKLIGLKSSFGGFW